MINEVAKIIVAYAPEGTELYEDYVPRGRNTPTTGVVVEKESDYWRAAANALFELVQADCEGVDDFDPHKFYDRAFYVQVDNLGKKYIFY